MFLFCQMSSYQKPRFTFYFDQLIIKVAFCSSKNSIATNCNLIPRQGFICLSDRQFLFWTQATDLPTQSKWPWIRGWTSEIAFWLVCNIKTFFLSVSGAWIKWVAEYKCLSELSHINKRIHILFCLPSNFRWAYEMIVGLWLRKNWWVIAKVCSHS